MDQTTLQEFDDKEYYLYRDQKFPDDEDILLKLIKKEKDLFTVMLVLEAKENIRFDKTYLKISKGSILKINKNYPLLTKISREKAMVRLL